MIRENIVCLKLYFEGKKRMELNKIIASPVGVGSHLLLLLLEANAKYNWASLIGAKKIYCCDL